MYFVLCFLYIFFAIVLGTYLGFELISARRAERVYRTMLRGAKQSADAMNAMAETGGNGPGPAPAPDESNYFGH
jgi:hypothetical protein